MQKADPQYSPKQNQPAARLAKGMSLASPQSEQISQLEAMADASPQVERHAQFTAAANDNPAAVAQRHLIAGVHNSPRATVQRQQLDFLTGDAVQRTEEKEPLQGKPEKNSPLQRQEEDSKPNNTGLPDNLKSGIESLSGISMDNVCVHYNSSQSAQLNAHAYAQGTDIHVAPGQEQHLPHEAWHVVQQAQGRVQPTMQMKKRVPINDDKSLEHEADVMGERAYGATVGTVPNRVGAQVSKRGIAPIQYARKDKDELLALTVSAFDTHRKAEQMDWANTTRFSPLERKVIWGILDWGTGGLASFTLDEIVNKVKADNYNFTHLKMYCDALTGQIGSAPVIQLDTLNDIDQAVKQGKWIVSLVNTVGGSHAKSTIPVAVFENLISDEALTQEFLDYYKNQHPILQTPTGEEVKAFIILVKNEGAKISDYTSDLPDIRNYHKFYKAALDKLKGDKGKKDKPLTLVLLSLFDHNGAFIRHTHVNKVITNTNTNAFAIEGADESKLTGLKDTGLAQIAADHGMGGKITQIMVAGHGSSKSMEVGGKETESGKSTLTGKDITIPDRKTEYDLEFDEKKGAFWTEFFNAAFANMEAKGGLNPKVLLRACLTGSNEIDLVKLKQVLQTDKGLDLDDSGIDPTTSENQAKIKTAIKEQFTTHGSLVSVLEGKATGKGIGILGAQASITADQTESVKDTGELAIIPATGISVDEQDPYVAGSKIDYVCHGKEPTGALKAVIESWANGEDTFTQMQARIDNPVATNDGFIIDLLYQTILSKYKKSILEANKLVSTAGVFHGIAWGGAECRASYLRNDAMTQTHQSDFYPVLLGQFAQKSAKLAIYEEWMEKNNSKRKEFVNQLADASFDKNSAEPFLDANILADHFNPILTGSLGSERGRILLALFGLIEKGQGDCKTFLAAQKDGDGKLLKVVTDELKGYSEDLLREKLGLPVEPAPLVSSGGSGSGASKPKKNIDVDGEYYVEPMRPTKFKRDQLLGSVRIRSKPDSSSAELESFSDDNREIIIVGEVKRINDSSSVGRYMVRRANGTIGYVSSSSIKKA